MIKKELHDLAIVRDMSMTWTRRAKNIRHILPFSSLPPLRAVLCSLSVLARLFITEIV
jgi:hypothetical protein